ncbi:hypothetical protein L484_000844 [Morus notabilis]|uniref:Putative plant transposon protein domain-containing protein n=1 Tax=Morus notabilis TaxID=981085 RepID=W9RBS1_9ROSA|nr:hypothetical protein L484_000844 [Morus notabilis]
MGKKSFAKRPFSSNRWDPAIDKAAAADPSSSTRQVSANRKFVDNAAEKRYEENIWARNLVKEKGFLLHDSPTLGQPGFISDVIISRGWQIFCRHPIDPIVPLVKEFYANLQNQGQNTVFVWEIDITFTSNYINGVLGIPNQDDEFVELITDAIEEQLKEVLKTIAILGAQWLLSAKGSYTCNRHELQPAAKVWYHFLASRLLLSTHGKTISRNRAILLYAVLVGKPINVGRLIIDQIRACAEKGKGGLYFPSLISELCIQSHVAWEASEPRLRNTGAMDLVAITRISSGRSEKSEKGEEEEEQDEPSRPSTSHTESASAAQSQEWLEKRMSLFEVQQFEMFELLLQQQEQLCQFWVYSRDRDMALKKSFQ